MAENTKLRSISFPSRLVIDASVVLAWLMADERTIIIEKLMANILSNQTELLAPVILPLEVVNSLKSAVTGQRVKQEVAFALINDFSKSGIKLHDCSPYSQVLTTALNTDTSSYDAAYVWLSLDQSAPLCTLDKKLQKKVAGLVEILDLEKIELKQKLRN